MANGPSGSVWAEARKERNFLLFAVFEGKNGKRGKEPCRAHNLSYPSSKDDAAQITYAEAQRHVEHYRNRGFDKENARRKEWAKKNNRVAKIIVDVEIGYLPRPGSRLVMFDIDNCVDNGQIVDDDIGEILADYSGYVEISTSGTGLRIPMPRNPGDSDMSLALEAGGVGFFANGEKGVILTGNLMPGFDTHIQRDRLVGSRLIQKRQAAIKDKREGREHGKGDGTSEDAIDQILHYGFVSLDEFRELVSHIPNKDIDRSTWIGLMLSCKEHFVLQGLEEEAWEIFDQWTAGQEDSSTGYNQDENREKWDIGGTQEGVSSLGSWFHLAQKNGWQRNQEIIGTDDEEEKLAAHPSSPEEALARFVIAEGKWYDRLTRNFISLEQLTNWTMNFDMTWMTKKGPKAVEKNTAARAYWMKSHATPVTGVGFYPGQPERIEDMIDRGGMLEEYWGAITLNTWLKPKLSPHANPTKAKPWIDHVKWLYPNDAEWIFDFLAFNVQNPGVKINWAIVLLGDPGIGKDMMLMPLRKALGTAFSPGVQFREIFGDYDDWIIHRTLVVVQEAHARSRYAAPADIAEKLKTYIAAPPSVLRVNPKGSPSIEIPNIVNMIFTTNNLDAIYVDDKDRRYAVFESVVQPKKDDYYARLGEFLEGYGADHVIAWLQRRQISLISAGCKPPRTSAKFDMVEASEPPVKRALRQKLEENLQGREWISTVEMKGSVWAEAEATRTSERSVEKYTIEVLKAAGFAKVEIPGGDRGRFWAVDIRQRVTIYAKRGSQPDEILDQLLMWEWS